MTNLQVYRFDGRSVRAVGRGQETWWVLSDICKALDLKDGQAAAGSLDEADRSVSQIYGLGGAQRMVVISERGLDALLERAVTPGARAFRYWITRVVRVERNASGDEPYIDRTAPERSSMDVAAFSRALRQTGIPVGRVQLYEVLRNAGFLKWLGNGCHAATWVAIDMGLLKNGDATGRSPRITYKGQLYLLDRFQRAMEARS